MLLNATLRLLYPAKSLPFAAFLRPATLRVAAGERNWPPPRGSLLRRPQLKAALAALAEKERRLISQRTRDALAQAKARGVRLGGLNAKGVQFREEARGRAEAMRPVLAELAGKSARAIAAELNARGAATPSGGRWHAETVIRVQRRLEAVS